MGKQKSVESYIGSDTTVVVYFDYLEGEAEVLYPNDRAQPYAAPEVTINAVWTVTGDDILDCLNKECLDRLEADCFESLE